MATLTLEEVYEQYIKPIPSEERLRVVATVARDLAETTDIGNRRWWREIRGIAPYPLTGEDAQNWITRAM